MKIITEKILETGQWKIRKKDLVSIMHKDGRIICGRLTDITNNMIYISKDEGTEVVQVSSIESAKLAG